MNPLSARQAKQNKQVQHSRNNHNSTAEITKTEQQETNTPEQRSTTGTAEIHNRTTEISTTVEITTK
jgi:hypothetical protein